MAGSTALDGIATFLKDAKNLVSNIPGVGSIADIITQASGVDQILDILAAKELPAGVAAIAGPITEQLTKTVSVDENGKFELVKFLETLSSKNLADLGSLIPDTTLTQFNVEDVDSLAASVADSIGGIFDGI